MSWISMFLYWCHVCTYVDFRTTQCWDTVRCRIRSTAVPCCVLVPFLPCNLAAGGSGQRAGFMAVLFVDIFLQISLLGSCRVSMLPLAWGTRSGGRVTGEGREGMLFLAAACGYVGWEAASNSAPLWVDERMFSGKATCMSWWGENRVSAFCFSDVLSSVLVKTWKTV